MSAFTVAIRGKADIPFALHMSAFDPKRTLLFSHPILPVCSFDLIRCLILSLGAQIMPIEQSRDPKQFSAFELSGWDTNIRGYNSAFGAVTRQTVGPMLDAADVTRGMRVLDVCCGPGMLAAGALERARR